MAFFQSTIRQEGFQPSSLNGPVPTSPATTSSMNGIGYGRVGGMGGGVGLDFGDEFVNLMGDSGDRGSGSPGSSSHGHGGEDPYRTHNIFDTSSLPPPAPQPTTNTFNSTLPALNSSMRYDPEPPMGVGARSRSRSRPPSSGGGNNAPQATTGGGGGPVRNTRTRRNNSISSTSPPPSSYLSHHHGHSHHPQAIIIPRSSSTSAAAAGAGGTPVSPWFHSSSGNPLPTPDSSGSIHNGYHSHNMAGHGGHHPYNNFHHSSSLNDPGTYGLHHPQQQAQFHPGHHQQHHQPAHIHGPGSLPKQIKVFGDHHPGLVPSPGLPSSLPATSSHYPHPQHPQHPHVIPNVPPSANAPATPISTTSGSVNVNGGMTNGTGQPDKQLLLASEKRRRRRESHNAVERRRRDNINEKISELATLIPECLLDGATGILPLDALSSGLPIDPNTLSVLTASLSPSAGGAPSMSMNDAAWLDSPSSPTTATTTNAANGSSANPNDTDGSSANGGLIQPKSELLPLSLDLSFSNSNGGDDTITSPTANGASAAGSQGAGGAGVVKANKGMILRKSVEYIRYLQQVLNVQSERNRELEREVRRLREGGAAAGSNISLTTNSGSLDFAPGTSATGTNGSIGTNWYSSTALVTMPEEEDEAMYHHQMQMNGNAGGDMSMKEGSEQASASARGRKQRRKDIDQDIDINGDSQGDDGDYIEGDDNILDEEDGDEDDEEFMASNTKPSQQRGRKASPKNHRTSTSPSKLKTGARSKKISSAKAGSRAMQNGGMMDIDDHQGMGMIGQNGGMDIEV